MLAGLCKAELSSLTVGQLHSAPDGGNVEVHAADEKNRKGSCVPLPPGLADDLRHW